MNCFKIALISTALATTVLFSSQPSRADEKPVAPTHKYARKDFNFDYPQSWKIDKSDPDYNPDRLFSIDAADDASSIMFMVLNGDLDCVGLLKKQEEGFHKIVKDAKRSSFTSWGSLEGTGVVLSGKCYGVLPMDVRAFCCRHGDETLLVIEQIFDDERSKVEPGFELVRRTFKFAK